MITTVKKVLIGLILKHTAVNVSLIPFPEFNHLNIIDQHVCILHIEANVSVYNRTLNICSDSCMDILQRAFLSHASW